jgi:hypothetical protein
MPRTAGPAVSTCGRPGQRPQAFYAGPWLDGIRERYGMDPQIRFFETACVTDNAIGAVLLPDATRS